jgi:hypothetical protein
VPDEVALAKGEHTARLLLRHDDRALLEKLKGTCLVSRRRRNLLLIGRLHICRCRPRYYIEGTHFKLILGVTVMTSMASKMLCLMRLLC